MCNYKEIENFQLTNGKTVGHINREVKKEIERIYVESWNKGISVPIFGTDGFTYLANPDGSEDKATFDCQKRTYNIIERYAPAGCGRFAYLLNK